MSLVEFLPRNHAIQSVLGDVRDRIIRAQRNVLTREFSSFADLCKRLFSDIKLDVAVPPKFQELPADVYSGKMFSELMGIFSPVLAKAAVPEHLLKTTASSTVRRLQLLMAFDDPDAVLRRTEHKVLEIVAKFPKKVTDIERGNNPGDVIDPYILAATQQLVFGGDFVQTISAAVSHKILMMIEGMIGHLHEDVIGEMRGNVRAPEPRGQNQEAIDPQYNPFPGADLLQPPLSKGDRVRFHQIKSKTGSAKGGDGRRLGDQLRLLEVTYGGAIYYDALIGNTLRGHRSKAAVIAAAPNVVVLVGAAAFKELTRSTNGPQLLLRLYLEAFQAAARDSGYNMEAVLAVILESFKQRADKLKEGLLEAILSEVTAGQADQQDSRLISRAKLLSRL